MPLVNPSLLKRPDSITETRTFTDPSQSEVSFELAFTAIGDQGFMDEITEAAAGSIRDYITGRNDGPAAPLPPLQGRAVILSKRMCGEIAMLMRMDETAVGEGEHRYDFLKWRDLSATMPNAYVDVVTWANELIARARGQLGN